VLGRRSKIQTAGSLSYGKCFPEFTIVSEFEIDWARDQRTGLAEAILCEGKSVAQIEAISLAAIEREAPLLYTRMNADQLAGLPEKVRDKLDYDEASRTAILSMQLPENKTCAALIVTAGTSDMPVALEAQRTLAFYGYDVPVIPDCGVAGLWRLTDKLEVLRKAKVIIAVAGMEGALYPVLSGLVPGLVIAVPRSVGYGVAEGGKAALSTALSSCSGGVVTVNIDNGYGAACSLIKFFR